MANLCQPLGLGLTPVKMHYLARALTIRLVADLSRSSNRVTVARLASLLMWNRFLCVTIVALLAVVAMSTGSVVLTLEAHTSRNAPWQLEELHVEPAPPGVVVALAGHALVGGEGGGPAPGAVEVKGLALFALAPGCVVLALAGHFSWKKQAIDLSCKIVCSM